MPDELTDLAAAVIREGSAAPDAFLQAVLHTVSDEPSQLVATYHPVGFVHVDLGVLADSGRKLRLHIWSEPPVPPQDPDWPVHSHAWHITSFILRGCVSNLLFDVEPVVNGDRRIYEVGYRDGVSTLYKTSQRVSCSLGAEHEIRAGTSYEVRRAEFHTTIAHPGSWAATLAVTDPPSKEPPMVVGDVAGEHEYSFRRSRVPPREFLRMLQQLV